MGSLKGQASRTHRIPPAPRAERMGRTRYPDGKAHLHSFSPVLLAKKSYLPRREHRQRAKRGMWEDLEGEKKGDYVIIISKNNLKRA